MQQFVTFIMHHWQLWLAFVVILGLLIGTELYNNLSGAKALAPQDLVVMMNRHNAITLDIREKPNFSKGHILGAINIPLTHLTENLAKIEQYKTQIVIIVDDLGQHSAKAIQTLRQQGFTQLSSLKGGMNAWITANLPLAKK